MADYILFTDAGGDIPPELCQKYGIRGVPMECILSGNIQTFSPDDPDREDQCQRFYDALRQQVEVSTSQITPFVYIDVFSPLLEAGCDILYCCFSSGLSATWSNVQTAQQLLKEKYPDRTLRCIDSRSAAAGQGAFVLQAAINRENGMSISENADWLEAHVQNVQHWFTVDDLDFLKRGGRVSPAVAFLGGKMQIKPILTILPDGSLSVKEKARGRKKSIDRLLALYQESMDFSDCAPLVVLNHAGCAEEGQALAQQVKAVSPPGTQVLLTSLSPIIGTHTGPNMLSIAHIGKRREQ